MAKQGGDEPVGIDIMLKEHDNDFIATLTEKEDKFLQMMMVETLSIAIKTIFADRKRKELVDELER